MGVINLENLLGNVIGYFLIVYEHEENALSKVTN